jgi:predicted alpha/beta hydrolase
MNSVSPIPSKHRPTSNLEGAAAPSHQVVQLRARDGFTIHADLYEPAAEIERVVLLAPAMGVRRGFYGAFASYLAQHGSAVLCLDYRGIGDSRPASLRGFHARLRDWGEQDLEGALDELDRRHGGVPRVFIGHSVGGQLLGLLSPGRVERALLVASQSGYYGVWPWKDRAKMAATWFVTIPLLARVFGYLPLKRLQGSGEDLPLGVALEWARWGRHPDYIMSYARGLQDKSFARFRGPLRAYAISDDWLAPRGAVETLVACFSEARSELRALDPASLGVANIGHFAAFRPAFRDSLWPELDAFVRGEAELSSAAHERRSA